MRRHLVFAAILTLSSLSSARAEVTACTVIGSLPAVINTSGTYCLKNNLIFTAATGIAIDIRSSPVILDLNGFWINNFPAGTSTQAIGIASTNRKDITIRNGIVRGFSVGIQFVGTAASGHVIENMHLDSNRYNGIYIEDAKGVVVRNNNIQNTVVSNSTIGILLSGAKNITIQDNVVNSIGGGAGGYGIYAYVSDLVEILNNSVLNTMGTSSNAVFVSGSTNVTVMGNRLLNGETAGSTGINVFGGPGINCINNVIARF